MFYVILKTYFEHYQQKKLNHGYKTTRPASSWMDNQSNANRFNSKLHNITSPQGQCQQENKTLIQFIQDAICHSERSQGFLLLFRHITIEWICHL